MGHSDLADDYVTPDLALSLCPAVSLSLTLMPLYALWRPTTKKVAAPPKKEENRNGSPLYLASYLSGLRSLTLNCLLTVPR